MWKQEGYNRGRYLAKTQVLQGHDYFMKIISEGEVLAEAQIDIKAKPKEIFPQQKNSGKFDILLEEPIKDAKLGIYDEEG